MISRRFIDDEAGASDMSADEQPEHSSDIDENGNVMGLIANSDEESDEEDEEEVVVRKSKKRKHQRIELSSSDDESASDDDESPVQQKPVAQATVRHIDLNR